MTATDLSETILTELSRITPGEICIYSKGAHMDREAFFIYDQMCKLNKHDYRITIRAPKEDFFTRLVVARRSANDGNTSFVFLNDFANLSALLKYLWDLDNYPTLNSNKVLGFDKPDILEVEEDPSIAGTTDSCQDCPYIIDSSLSLISAKIPQTKEEMFVKLNELFEEAAYKGYDMDEIITALQKKYAENDAINYDEYGIRIEYAHTKEKAVKLSRCDIYVKKNDTPLKLTAIEKSTYLTYLLYEEGVSNDLTKGFMSTLATIYAIMADTSMRDSDFGGAACSKLYNPQTNSFEYNYIDPDTITTYRTAIKKEINKHIGIKRLAQDFCIEGIKNKPFKVVKSTPELREQIRQIFHLK